MVSVEIKKASIDEQMEVLMSGTEYGDPQTKDSDGGGTARAPDRR